MKPIVIPKVKNLITARPEGMDFETYKAIRKDQQEYLHGYNVKDGNAKRHVNVRLDGVCISAIEYHGHKSNFFPVVIK
jgi:hypothetical protein